MFHVFTWICTIPDRDAALEATSSMEKPARSLDGTFAIYHLDGNRYKKAKSEIGAFLEKRLDQVQTKMFSDTPEKTMSNVAELHETIVHGFNGDQSFKMKVHDPSNGLSAKAEFAWAAKVMLEFFFPAQTEDKILRKYWGGVHAILSLPVVSLSSWPFPASLTH